MTLALYLFRQFIPPFLFGSVLFLFVLLLDRLFDIVDLIFNKGVNLFVVIRLFALFIPTILPLTLPMACLLACLVTFGRLSGENELTAVRAAGISLLRVLWLPPLFALFLSAGMIPFNTHVAPWSNRAFRQIYEKIAAADPLINIEPKKFFNLKNIKIFAQSIDKADKKMRDLFVYKLAQDGRPADRIFARIGEIQPRPDSIVLVLQSGQMQSYSQHDPSNLTHTAFGVYTISIPLNQGETESSTRFRNISTPELKKLIGEMKNQKLSTAPLQAEYHLRYAVAFASLALVLMGMPLATILKRGGRSFGFGISIVVLFAYYTLLIFGLTLAEKGVLPAPLALWMGNLVCFVGGATLIWRLQKQ